MKKLILLTLFAFLLTSANIFAQLTVKDQDATPNILVQFNDEGTAGSITFPPLSTISTYTNKLYNISGNLYWNGHVIPMSSSGSGATDINGLYDGISDNASVYLGLGSGSNDDLTDNGNTGVGLYSLNHNTSGINNVAIGLRSLQENLIGQSNIAIGYYALELNQSASSNVAIGEQALRRSTGGNNNIAIGRWAGSHIINGDKNALIGESVFAANDGSYNAALGYQAGTNASGNGNIFIGYQAGANSTGGNKLFIDNTSTASPLIWGDFYNRKIRIKGNGNYGGNISFYVVGTAGGSSAWTSSSDRRLKKNIKQIDNALVKVQKLRGVNFNWKDTARNKEGKQMGFIAQEAKEIIPEVVNKAGKYYSMQYAPITALLVEAVKEQQKTIEKQQKLIEDLIERTNKLESKIGTKRFTSISN